MRTRSARITFSITALLLSILLISISSPGMADAQTLATSTKGLPSSRVFLPTKLIIPRNLIKLSTPVFNTQIISGLVLNKAALKYSTYFTGSMDIQNPSEMILGNTEAVKLTITPSDSSSSSSIQVQLVGVADKITIVPDVQPERQVNGTAPLQWTWVIDPKAAGNHILLLNITYNVNQENTSSARWDSIEVDLHVVLPPTDTATSTAPPTTTPSATLTPLPTLTLGPSDTPIPTITVASTATPTNSEKMITGIVANPVPLIAALVTLMLGLLTLYFQNIRKR
jgi:hypothetical protein